MNLVWTILGAFVLMVLAIVFLSIGRLLTGKWKLRRGGCGMVPRKGKEKKSGCDLCGSEKSCEDETKP